jgi:hypothetical protein
MGPQAKCARARRRSCGHSLGANRGHPGALRTRVLASAAWRHLGVEGVWATSGYRVLRARATGTSGTPEGRVAFAAQRSARPNCSRPALAPARVGEWAFATCVPHRVAFSRTNQRASEQTNKQTNKQLSEKQTNKQTNGRASGLARAAVSATHAHVLCDLRLVDDCGIEHCAMHRLPHDLRLERADESVCQTRAEVAAVAGGAGVPGGGCRCGSGEPRPGADAASMQGQ